MIATTQPVYELWDTETGNLIGDYIDEAAALLDVKEGIQTDGGELWLSVALARVEPGGERIPIAQGTELIARANSTSEKIDDNREIAKGIAQATRVLATIRAFDTITNFDFDAVTQALQAISITSATLSNNSEVQRYKEAAQAVFTALSAATGVSIHVETTADIVAFSTPDETVAGLLAARLSRMPRQVHLRVIENVYRIEFKVPEADGDRRVAS